LRLLSKWPGSMQRVLSLHQVWRNPWLVVASLFIASGVSVWTSYVSTHVRVDLNAWRRYSEIQFHPQEIAPPFLNQKNFQLSSVGVDSGTMNPSSRTASPKKLFKIHQLLAARLLFGLNVAVADPLAIQTPTDHLGIQKPRDHLDIQTPKTPMTLAQVSAKLDALYYSGLGSVLAGLDTRVSSKKLPIHSSLDQLLASAEKLEFDYPKTTQHSSQVLADQISVRQAHPVVAASNLGQSTGSSHFVEAFDPETTLDGVSVDGITQERFKKESDESPEGWALATVGNHLSTLYWRKSDFSDAVPLLSMNTLHLLKSRQLGSVNHSADSGLVYGVIPRGWQVAMGVGEQYFGKCSFPRNAASSTLLFFICPNVRPGSRTLYANAPAGEGSGGVVVPVLRGMATYLDLTRAKFKTVVGTVYDELTNRSENGPYPFPDAAVRVFGGDERGISHTDQEGRFQVRVLTTSLYPVVMDSADPEGRGLVHRHTWMPSMLDQPLALYRMHPAEVEERKQQAQRMKNQDIAPGTGSVFTVFGGLKPGSYRVDLSSLQGSLTPWVYSLADSGELGSNAVRIKKKKPHYSFATQVQEGPAVLRLKSDEGLVYSRMIYAQEGVIEMVGPVN
jgi:hypothetical protein